MSTSSPTTFGPIRAVTSNLLARSLPSVPPAAKTYEPHARAVLRHRLLREIFPATGFYVWLATSYWAYWNASQSGKLGVLALLTLPFKPATLFASLLTWTFVALPVIVLRRDNVSATPTAAVSPSSLLKAAYAKQSTRTTLAIFISTSLSFIVIQLSISSFFLIDEDQRLRVFVKSRKHPYFLNGRFIYLVFAQLSLGAAFHLRDVLLDRYVVQWKESFSQRQTARYAQRAAVVGIASLLLTSSALFAYTVVFALARALVLPILLRVPILSLFLRPFTAHFIRGSWTPFLILSFKNIRLLIRTFSLSFTLASIWEFTETVFDEKVRKPVGIANNTADVGITLVSGVTSQNPYYAYFAYHELSILASEITSTATERRSALFADQRHNPSLWATLVRDALLRLGQDYQLLLRRGKPAPPAPPAAPAPAKPQLPLPPATPVLRTQVFKAQRSSPLRAAMDALAADGALAKAVQTSASHLPAVFQSSPSASAAPKPEPSQAVVVKKDAAEKKNESAYEKLVAVVGSRTPPSVKAAAARANTWWAGERTSRVAESALPNRDLDVLVIQVLTNLVCASLAEDKYGVVQRDIPRIIEALLSFLTALEEYQTELAGVSDVEERSRATDVLIMVADPIKVGIAKVIQTFGEKMAAFKFPPRTARRLQGFVDYR